MQHAAVFTQASISGKWNVCLLIYIAQQYFSEWRGQRGVLRSGSSARSLSVSPTKHPTRPTPFMNYIRRYWMLFINLLQPAWKWLASSVASLRAQFFACLFISPLFSCTRINWVALASRSSTGLACPAAGTNHHSGHLVTLSPEQCVLSM